MMMLPPSEGVCSECAVAHEPHEPHDKESLYYQYHFYGNHGRWPTWKDAIAHVSPEMQAIWEEELRKENAWDGWEGDTPPVPDALPTPGSVGTLSIIDKPAVEDA